MDVADILDKARNDQEVERAKRYTPEMVVELRRTVLRLKTQENMGPHMPYTSARLHAEADLEQWEIHQLARAHYATAKE